MTRSEQDQHQAERDRVLNEFADGVIAGRAVWKVVRWLAVAGVGVAACAYYVIGAWNGWHQSPSVFGK